MNRVLAILFAAAGFAAHGPKAPKGFEKNGIPTVSGKNWFAYFRFYNPTEAYVDRSWPLPDFEEAK